jgi:hypothetical protein
MNKEELIQEMNNKIDTCKIATCYTDEQIALMKENGNKLFGKMYSLQGKTYLLKEDEKSEPKEVLIEFVGFKFGHNDFQVLCEKFEVNKCMKEIFADMREKGELGGQGSNGWGTAFVLSYEPWSKLN